MIRFLKALVLLPFAVLVVLLAVANRAPVQVSLDPFSQDAPEIATEVPLYAVIFAAVVVGVLIGGIATWLAQSKHRRARRQYRREARHLKVETERMRSQAAHPGMTALPPARSA
jgi:uncharacterized integral membrane protein